MSNTMNDTINPNSLFNSLKDDKHPPVDSWDPPFCGKIDICIHRNGVWSYNQSPFSRMPLVKMFARVLKRENDDYFLVTPVEKVQINVEAEPFTTISVEQQYSKDGDLTQIAFKTNLDEIVIAGKKHPIQVINDIDGNPYPTILVRKNLFALISRSDFYQLVDLATSIKRANKTICVIESNGCVFELGEY